MKTNNVNMSWVVGKIGFCLDKDLGIIRQDNKNSKGHFVYIHKIDKFNKCTISTFISMYDNNGLMKSEQIYNGYVLPIPKYSSSFKSFTGLSKNKISNIDLNKIMGIGKWYISNGYIRAYQNW